MKRQSRGLAFILSVMLLLSGCGKNDAAPGTVSTELITQPTVWTPPVTTEAVTEPISQTTQSMETESILTVHFIDVGQADAALVVCDGEAMLIDGGNAEDSNLMYSYLQKQEINHLSYVVGTHAHEDHIGGLAGALNYATADVVYCPTTSYNTRAFENFSKAVDKQGISITVPSVGDQFFLGSAKCEILGVNIQPEDANNSSIVLRIDYGKTSFLFTGDGETPVEQKILDSGKQVNATVLKVGHHGSCTSSGYSWLWNVMPQYAVISVGTDNEYGHPHDEVLSRLRDGNITTFRTDIHGDILCVSDGEQVQFSVSWNREKDPFGEIGENSTQQEKTDYVVNTNSGKFHDPDCSGVEEIKEENRWEYFGTRDELIQKGYDPCKQCDP